MTTTGLDNLGLFKLPPGAWYGHNGPKWLTVPTVREVFCDTCTDVFFLVVEFTPKKGDSIGPLFEGPTPVRKAPGPVWHVIRWDYPEFKRWVHEDQQDRWRLRLSDAGALFDLAVQIAQNDGLGAVHGMRPVGIGPWPKRAQALMALCDVATREREAYEQAQAQAS